MEIKNISLHELRKMNDSEGLVIQGCGGDLQEWADGINEMLTERGILQNESRFEKAYTFNNEKLTCLLMTFSLISASLRCGGLKQEMFSVGHGLPIMLITN